MGWPATKTLPATSGAKRVECVSSAARLLEEAATNTRPAATASAVGRTFKNLCFMFVLLSIHSSVSHFDFGSPFDALATQLRRITIEANTSAANRLVSI